MAHSGTPPICRRSYVISKSPFRTLQKGNGVTKTDVLSLPFAPHQIKQRKGSNGKTYDYVSGGDVIKRLMEATDDVFDWHLRRLELVASKDGPAFWLAEGTLTLPNLGSRDGVGTHPAFDLESPKSAETDALKRAAKNFGVALHLYCDPHEGVQTTVAVPAARQQEATPQSHTSRIQNREAKGQSGRLVAGQQCSSCFAPVGKQHTNVCKAAA